MKEVKIRKLIDGHKVSFDVTRHEIYFYLDIRIDDEFDHSDLPAHTAFKIVRLITSLVASLEKRAVATDSTLLAEPWIEEHTKYYYLRRVDFLEKRGWKMHEGYFFYNN